MKLLRIWLVVLLTVVLPLKGVMAAAMLCPPGAGVPSELAVIADSSAHGHEGMPHADGDHDHVAHGHGHERGQHDHGKGVHDKCNICSSSCSSPSMPSTSLDFTEPEALTSQSFPDPSAPAATFQSDGLERPPRTI